MINDKRVWTLTWGTFGVIVFTYYITLCGLYWQSRMFHVDSALYLFEILNNKLPFMGPRPGSMLTQALPIFSHHSGLNLNTTGFVYSISFGIIYVVIAVFTFLKTKKLWTIPFFSLLLIITTRDTFYNPVNEVSLAIFLAGGAFCFGLEWMGGVNHSVS
jgi:hypothetical protein